MKKIICLLFVVFFSSSAYTKDIVDIYNDYCTEFKGVINFCINEVHKNNYYSGFDAYFDFSTCLQGKFTPVHFFGTPLEHFKFGKCMSENGFPLELEKKKL